MAVAVTGGTGIGGGAGNVTAAGVTDLTLFTTPNTANALFLVRAQLWTANGADLELVADGRVVDQPQARHVAGAYKMWEIGPIKFGPNVAVQLAILNTHASSARRVDWRYDYVGLVIT